MIPTSIDGTDITGATIDGTDVQEITVDGDVVFSAGGAFPNRIYIANSTNVEQFNTSGTLSSASSVATLSYGSFSSPRGVNFADNGNELYVADRGGDIFQFTCSTPYEISSASFTGSHSVLKGNGVAVSDDGTQVVYGEDDSSGDLELETMSTPFDITTAGSKTTIKSGRGWDVQFADDGGYLYGYSGGINRWELTTPYDVTTRTNLQIYSVSIGRGFHITNDGTKYFELDTNICEQYDLSTPYDINSKGGVVDSFAPTTSNGTVHMEVV